MEGCRRLQAPGTLPLFTVPPLRFGDWVGPTADVEVAKQRKISYRGRN
jgi:hypothetical protein